MCSYNPEPNKEIEYVNTENKNTQYPNKQNSFDYPNGKN